MRSISALIAVNSASIVDCWAVLTVPLEASVASVTARLRSAVTCERAPSATCREPTPSDALRADWVRAVMLAWRPSAIANPAASSAPELIREPDDSCESVFWSDAWVIANWFCAARDETLLRILNDMLYLLF